MNATIKKLTQALNKLAKAGYCKVTLNSLWEFIIGEEFEKKDDLKQIVKKFKKFRRLSIVQIPKNNGQIEMNANGLKKRFIFGESEKQDEENYQIITEVITDFIPKEEKQVKHGPGGTGSCEG